MGKVAEVGSGVADDVVEAPRQRCQTFQNLMESNDVGGIFVGRGISRASKRAKEHQNWSPDELVMAETVKHGTLKLGGAVVPLVMGSSTARVGIF